MLPLENESISYAAETTSELLQNILKEQPEATESAIYIGVPETTEASKIHTITPYTKVHTELLLDQPM